MFCAHAPQAAAAVANHAAALVALLDVADGDGAAAQETPFGALRPPLGLARLKVRRRPCRG